MTYQPTNAELEAAAHETRAVTTAEALDALAIGSVVVGGDGIGVLYQKLSRSEGVYWYEPGYALHWESRELNLPATVLHYGGKS